MTKSSESSPLLTKKWRAITYDFDNLASNSLATNLYCLTDFQVAWLLSNTEYMRWLSRWSNCPCTEEELDAMASELEYRLMTCYEFQPYQLDFMYQQANRDLIDRYTFDFDTGGIPELNPDTPTDFYSGDGSPSRTDALCTACYLYCYSYANEWVSRAQSALGIAIAVGLASSVTVVGGVIASVLVGGLAFITNVALEAFNDTDALDDVVCCMNDALVGQVVNETNFQNSLNACSFTAGSNQAIIRDIIAADLDQRGNWLSFLNSLGDSFIFAENGVNLCPCSPTGVWTQVFDFEVNNGGFTALAVGGGRGIYTTGVGWEASATIEGASRNFSVDISRTVAANTSVLTSIRMEGLYFAGQQQFPVPHLSLIWDSEAYDEDIPDGSYDVTHVPTINNTGVTTFRVVLRCANKQGSTPVPQGSGRIVRLTYSGTGANPFL